MNAVVVVSLVCRAAKGTLMALSRNASHRYDYSTSTVSLTVTGVEILYSLIRMKWKERENGYARKSFSLTEILLMSVPAYLSFVSSSFYFILQRLLEDELIIQSFSVFKVAITGFLSIIVIRRKLTSTHWAAIVILCTSVGLIERKNAGSSSFDFPFYATFIALISMLFDSLSSVITELLLKRHRNMDIAQQNIWLYFWSGITQLLSLVMKEGSNFPQRITFRNFNTYAYALVITESLRGLTTLRIQKEIDSVAESFISSMSLMVAAFFVSVLMRQSIPYPGTGNIMIAGYLYHSVPRPVSTIDSTPREEEHLTPDAIDIESEE
ncbi:hypothetical protein BLSTO_01996 [Blastocystis sp. subtype 1]